MERGSKLPIARLEIADGGFVANVYVLPFNEPPQVILWGSRVFTLYEKSTEFSVNPDVYREAFAWYALEVAE